MIKPASQKKESPLRMLIEMMMAPSAPKSKNQIRREKMGLDPGSAQRIVSRGDDSVSIEGRARNQRALHDRMNTGLPGYRRLTLNPKKIRRQVRREMLAA